MSVVVGPYEAVEQPGAGRRASPCDLWRGRQRETLTEVAMIVLPVEYAAAAETEVEAVAEIRHPHLLAVIDVAVQADRVAVVCPWPAGGRLSELLVRRGRLAVPETLTVLMPLASALAAAHAAGVRHGGVCPEAVWFDTEGRPLLGAAAVSRLIAELNDGMPVGCRDVAPEVVRGERLHGVALTTAADIFSLGSVALLCLTGRSAWPADDPADVLVQSAAGLWPEPPADVGPAPLVDLVRDMLESDPERRPTAADVVERLAAIGEPAPIAFQSGPTPVPASTDRWRGWQAAAGTTTTPADPADPSARAARTTRPAGPPTPRSAEPAAAAALDRAERRRVLRERLLYRAPDVIADPAEEQRVTPVARAGIAVLVAMLITVVAVQVGAWWSGRDQPESTVAAPTASASWPAVVGELDAARGRALAAADTGLLQEVYDDPGSPAAMADAATIEQLATKGWRVVDPVHEIVSVAEDTPATAESVRLAVVDVLPARPIVDAAGTRVGATPARPEQRRILVLRATGDGFRISAVEPG